MSKKNPKPLVQPKMRVLLLIFFVLLAAALLLLFLGKTRQQNQAAYVLLALDAAVLTYGILGSTGKIKTKRTQISGAAAVFIVILVVVFSLIREPRVNIRGVIYLNGIPPKKATIYLLETELRDNRRILEERDKGQFEFKDVVGVGDRVRFSIIIPGHKEKVVSYPSETNGIIRIMLSPDKFEELQAEFKKPDLETDLDRAHEMIFIPSGKFFRGTGESEIRQLTNNHPDWNPQWLVEETPQREIILDSFYISKYEVTNKQYGNFLKDNPDYERPGSWNDGNFNGPEQPVVGVSWYDAAAYCNWLSEKTKKKYRLPTEAEWEKAARGTDGRFFPWGNEEPGLNKANFAGQLHGTVSVKKNIQGISAFGLMNMAGNVSEWCADWYDENYYQLTNDRNPGGPATGKRRVVRGGSWQDNIFFMRTTARNSYPPDTKKESLGFRVVRVPGN
ncbi:MAG: formylglycine-generating enzyme family protein [Candidatus Aminicenantes bacterium]|jgi:iron(II)-dependent oxidoreductase